MDENNFIPQKNENTLAICQHKSQKNCQIFPKISSSSTEKRFYLSLQYKTEQTTLYDSTVPQVKGSIREVLKDISPYFNCNDDEVNILSDIEIFNMSSKSVLQKTAKNLLSMVFQTNLDDLEFIQEVLGLENLDENPLSLKDELEEATQHSAKTPPHFKSCFKKC